MTPHPDDLTALIERVEKLNGPCRETDAIIDQLMGRVPDGAFRPCAAIDVGTWALAAQNGYWTSDRYTASVDAALTLLPAGWLWDAGFSKHVPHVARVWPGPRPPHNGFYVGECDSNRAIALCLAALRALSSQGGEHGG